MKTHEHQNMGSPVYEVHFTIHLKKAVKEEELRRNIITWAECRPENLRLSKRPDGDYGVEIVTGDVSCIDKINKKYDRKIYLVEDLHHAAPRLRS